MVSMVMSPNQPNLSFKLKLLRSTPTFNHPEQMWQFVSEFSVRDYSGTYYIKLIPCTVTQVCLLEEKKSSMYFLVHNMSQHSTAHKIEQRCTIKHSIAQRNVKQHRKVHHILSRYNNTHDIAVLHIAVKWSTALQCSILDRSRVDWTGQDCYIRYYTILQLSTILDILKELV